MPAGAFRRQATRPPPPEDDDDPDHDSPNVTLVPTTPLRLRGKDLPPSPGVGKGSPPTVDASVASEGVGLDPKAHGMDSPPAYTRRSTFGDGKPKVESLLANEDEFMKELEGQSFPPGRGSPYLPRQGGVTSAGYGSGQFSTNLE